MPNDHFTATKNPHYWRPGLPYLDSITYKPIPDPDQLYSSLSSGSVDIMHSDTPEVIIQLRADSSLGYIDDSKNVAGEPDMGCILLNLSKAPFNNLKVRQATAYAVSSAQYVEVIDKGVNATSNGPFVTGLPVLRGRQRLPGLQRGQGQVPGQGGGQGDRQARLLHPQPHPGRQHHQDRRVPAAAAPDGGHAGHAGTHPAGRHHQHRPPRRRSRPRCGGSSGRSTPTSTTSFGAPPTPTPRCSPSTWPATPTPTCRRPCSRGASRRSKSAPVAAYQEVSKLMGQDIPYVWFDRSTLGHRRRAEGAELRQPDHPGRGQGLRPDRRLDLAHPDLAQLLTAPDPAAPDGRDGRAMIGA